MSVKQKYLEDEENNVFSPVTYMGGVYKQDKGAVIDWMSQYSTLIFVGHSSNTTISAATTFTPYKIQTSDFDKFGKFSSTDGYIIPDNGWYSIYVRFQLESLVGASNLKRNIMLGYCINNNGSDGQWTSRWVQQEFDRCAVSHSNMIQLNKDDKISFQYYCDGSTSKKISASEIFIIKSEQYEISDEASLGGGNIKVQYLRDENNEIFSPVTDSSSLYFGTKNYDETFGNCIRLAAMVHRSEGSMSSGNSADANKSINWSKKYSEYTNTNLLIKASDNGIPKYSVKQDGWYIIGITARFPDNPNVAQDVLLDVVVSGESNWVSASRSTYRMGGSGGICRHLYKGDTISFRLWRDNSFTTIRYLDCFVKYCGDNF